MTTAELNRGNAYSRPFNERLTRAWHTYFASGDILTYVILTAMLLMPALALRAADWPISMRVIVPVCVSSTLLGLVLARSQFNELLSLIVGTTYGLCFIILAAAIQQPLNLADGVYEVFIRAVTWVIDATTGGINQDDLVFTLLVATLFWFLGYNGAWHVFRIDRIWRVVLPPGLILVTNSVFYNGDVNLNMYLSVFLFMAMLLIVRSNLDAREWEWYVNGVRAPRRLRYQFLGVGAILALSTLFFAWNTPSGNLQERLDQFQEFLQSDPLTEMSEFWNRLFSPIEATGPTTADYYGGDSLDLGGAIQLGDQTVFTVNAPPDRRYYWRSRVFDTYESGRWTPAADTLLTDRRAPFDVLQENTAARELVSQEFTVELNGTRIIYTAPQPVQIDLPTQTYLKYTAPEGDPNRVMNVSAVRPLQVIRRDETYQAVSAMSVATALELRAASTAYPEWLSPTYFYVSPSVTERTLQLARDIVTTAGATNPYDQAKAIETWLRGNILYNESIPTPPRDQDPVDWVLFDYREGYCNYYASAMIVMLRSLGIPSRMAAGFAQGDWDTELGQYVVTERDAHTWVEAYFPGYGWIEFEPTAAQAQLDREGDQDVSPQQQVVPPASEPTATPTLTPTPLPSATPEFTSTPPPPDQQNNPDPPTPTITPTFTPTPTATPVIVPTQPAPNNPEPQGPLAFILPAIGLALLGLFILAIIVAILTFIWWWWEWRGMRGLSPITRAYARLERYAGLIGIRFQDQQTPEERRKVVVRGLPKAERPVTAITRMYITERYGPARNPAEEAQRTTMADDAWADTRSNILRRWLRKFTPWRRE